MLEIVDRVVPPESRGRRLLAWGVVAWTGVGIAAVIGLVVYALSLISDVFPYLAVAALIFSGLAGIDAGAKLPDPVDVDPASLTEAERAERGIAALPSDVLTATDAFEADEALTVGFGPELAATIVDVRRGEAARFADAGSSFTLERRRPRLLFLSYRPTIARSRSLHRCN